MNTLIRIFEDLKYSQVLDIAEEFYFHHKNEVPKSLFEKYFAEYLVKEGYDKEVIARYTPDKSLETEEPERAIELFGFQVQCKTDIIEGFEQGVTCLLTSEPGTGKTFIGISMAETEKRPMIVVCPKAVMLNWYILSIKQNVEILAICNYETFITGRIYVFSGDKDVEKLPKIDNPYLRKIKKKGRGAKDNVEFEWKNLPEKTLVIFDEAHFCKNDNTQRTQLMLGVYSYAKHPENRWKKINLLLMSATIIERKDNLRPFMYVLGYGKSVKDKSIIDDVNFSVKEFGYRLLAQKRMSRVTMKEARESLNDTFRSDVKVKMFKLDEADRKKIQEFCEEIRAVLLGTGNAKSQNHLAVRQKKRQEIEALKTGIFFNELKVQLAAGFAVGIFVNFIKSLEALQNMIKKDMPGEIISLVKGGQTANERLLQMENFQKGVSRIILCMASAGGTGISLHDVYGIRPHYGLHSPPESATQILQQLGRMDRLGQKSNSIQRIVFIADTIEEKIGDALLTKMKMIGDLNGDGNDAKLDNLFMYDEVHKYEQNKSETVASKIDAGKVRIQIDKARQQIVVTVPDYMVDAFEKGIPNEALVNMFVDGDKYRFAVKDLGIIQEFLGNLIR